LTPKLILAEFPRRGGEHPMPRKQRLACITGGVNEGLLRRIEYLLEENRVLRNEIQKRILLTDHERCALAERAVALGKLMPDTVSPSPACRRSKWHCVRILPAFKSLRVASDR
jgi:hypothetical protein